MIAAFLIYHLACGLLACAVAWGLELLAMAVSWPRRGVWAIALLASLALPIGIMLNVTTQEQQAVSFQKVDKDEITGAIPATTSHTCRGGNCDQYVAIVCSR